MELNERVLKMMTKQGFVELFWSEMASGVKHQTHENVYDALEDEYFNVFKRRRYASFNSFRRRRDERR